MNNCSKLSLRVKIRIMEDIKEDFNTSLCDLYLYFDYFVCFPHSIKKILYLFREPILKGDLYKSL